MHILHRSLKTTHAPTFFRCGEAPRLFITVSVLSLPVAPALSAAGGRADGNRDDVPRGGGQARQQA